MTKHYFSSRDEAVLNAIVIAAIVLFTVEMIFKVRVSPVEAQNWNMFKNVVLLNSVHLVFPFLFLGFFAPGKQLVRAKLQNTGDRRFLLLAFSAIFILAIFTVNKSLLPAGLEPLRYWTVHLFWIIVPMLHSIRQSWGISALMTKATPSAQGLKNYARVEGKMMLLYSVGYVVLFVFNDIAELRPFQIVPALVCIGFAAMAMLSAWRTQLFRGTNKLMFMLRLLLWPLFPFSKAIQMFLILSHGYEYIALLKKGFDLQDTKVTTVFALFGIFVFYVVIIEVLRLTDYASTTWAAILLTSYSFITISHYFIDSLIYRFKDKAVRDAQSSWMLSYK
ncbi:MAG: hypothetical protein HRT45_14550 [Bdellovibrionales bacterium]|nr:hypothetical protein [Bdellovibrionales bacterium]